MDVNSIEPVGVAFKGKRLISSSGPSFELPMMMLMTLLVGNVGPTVSGS